MQKQTKKLTWLIFVLFQAFLGSSIGLFALSGNQIETAPAGTCVNEINIGGMDYDKARFHLLDYYDFLMSKGKVKITINEDRHSISYDQIDAVVDVDKTLDGVFGDVSGNALKSLIAGEGAEVVHTPVMVFNSGKLAAELEKIFSQYGREPVPDSYRMEDGQLIYSPEIDGIRVDYMALEKRFSAHIQSLSQETLALNWDDSDIFLALALDDKEGRETFRFILSSSSIPLGEADLSEAQQVLKGLNGNRVPPGGRIQLSSMIDLDHKGQEGRRDLINRAATAVYQAFMPVKGVIPVNRRPSAITLPYSDPGLEAVIDGDNGDMILENSTQQTLMLLCEIRNESLLCYVVSPEELPAGVLIAQKKDIVAPPVIYSVNSDLKKDERVVVSEGREGYTIYVERLIGNDRETLYTDEYDPVGRVVETGDSPLQTGTK